MSRVPAPELVRRCFDFSERVFRRRRFLIALDFLCCVLDSTNVGLEFILCNFNCSAFQGHLGIFCGVKARAHQRAALNIRVAVEARFVEPHFDPLLPRLAALFDGRRRKNQVLALAVATLNKMRRRLPFCPLPPSLQYALDFVDAVALALELDVVGVAVTVLFLVAGPLPRPPAVLSSILVDVSVLASPAAHHLRLVAFVRDKVADVRRRDA